MSDSTTSKYWELVIHPQNEGERQERIHIRTPSEQKLGTLRAKIEDKLKRDGVTLLPVNETVGREAWSTTRNKDEILVLGSLGLGSQVRHPNALFDDITNFRDVFMVREAVAETEEENDASESPVSDESAPFRPKVSTEGVERTLKSRGYNE